MNRLFRSTSALLIALVIPTAASAELRRVEMKTLGMDWAVCAHAVRVAMQKLPGVEDVHVSLKTATTDIRLRAGNTVSLAQLREVIKNGGFKAGEAHITAVGRLVDGKGQLALDLAPARATLLLEADPRNAAALAEARKLRATPALTVEVTGTVVKGDSLMLQGITQIKK